MKTLKLKMQDLTNPTILTHHEIKNILGGSGVVGGSTYSCSFTLTADNGETLDVPISSGMSTNAEDCTAACKVYCDNATHCKSYSAVFESSNYILN